MINIDELEFELSMIYDDLRINQFAVYPIFCDNPKAIIGGVPIFVVTTKREIAMLIDKDINLFNLWMWVFSDKIMLPINISFTSSMFHKKQFEINFSISELIYHYTDDNKHTVMRVNK